MAGIATGIIIGNLGQDPEIRYTPSGAMLCSFSIAATRKWNDQNGKQQEKTNWFRCTAWGRLAETMEKLVNMGAMVKGKQVYVTGDLDMREYVGRDGVTRTSADIKVVDFQLLGSKADSNSGSQRQMSQQQQQNLDEFNFDPSDLSGAVNPLRTPDPVETVKPVPRTVNIPF